MKASRPMECHKGYGRDCVCLKSMFVLSVFTSWAELGILMNDPAPAK